MVFHKIRLVIGCILIALIVSVNTFTIVAWIGYAVNGKPLEGGSAIDEAAPPGFPSPAEMTVRGRGASVTVTTSDEKYEYLLILNERRYTYVPSLEVQESFDAESTDAYCIEYLYDSPVEITLRGYKSAKVTRLTFVLTGRHEGKIVFKDGENTVTLGFLSVEPDLNLTVVDMLNNLPPSPAA